MSIESGSRVVGLVLALWCASAFAGGELANPTVGGDWNADATWSGGVRPQSGEEVTVTPSGNIKLTMSADDETDYKKLYFKFAGAEAASVEFDGTGYELLMPYSEAGNYLDSPVQFLDKDGKRLLTLDEKDAEAKGKAAPLLLDNAHFTLSAANGRAKVRLDQGTFNMYDPAGTAYPTREVMLGVSSQPFNLEVVNGAKAIFPKFWVGSTVAGGLLVDHAEFAAYGGAEFGRNNASYHAAPTPVYATNSTFTLGGDIRFCHATTNVLKNCVINGGSGLFANSWNSKLVFENCTVTNTGSLRIAENGGNGYADAEMVFDGGTYYFGYPQLGNAGNSRGHMVITGGADFEFRKGGDLQGQHIGWRGTGVVDVVSGTLRTPLDTYCQIRVGQYSDKYGTGCGLLNVYDEGHVVIRTGTASWAAGATEGLAVGGAGHGEAHVYGGRIDAPQVNIGFAATELTTESFVRQTGGTVAVNTMDSPNYSRVGIMTFCNTGGGTWDDRDFANHGAYYLDGGVLEAARILGGKGSACQGGSGWSKFSADGGTFRQNMAPAAYVTMTGFDVAEFGAKGLTFDSNGFDVKIEQDLVNKEGEDGLFVKTGAGTLTYSGDCSVSELVISNGVWQLAAGATCSSALTVAPGAELSFVGASTGVEVSAFSLENATLSLDPGDQIVVDGDAVVRDLTLRFSVPLTKDDTQTVFVVKGTLDAESAAAIRRAYCPMSVADGTHVQFRVTTAGGVTTITVAVEDDADPIGDEDTMVWTGSGSWSEPANWSPTGTPNETKKAAFTSAAAGKEVEVGTAAVVGALTFGENGFSLSGEGSLEIAGDRGAAQIEATAGENEVAVPLAFDSVVMMPIDEGAKMTLSGPISYGGFKKTGEGELRLEGDNSFIDEVTLAGGKVSIGGDSLGGTVPIPVRIEGGLVDVERADAAPITMTRPLNPAVGDVPLVFNVKSDVSFPLEYTSGRLFKRGIGTMEMSLADRQQLDSGIRTWEEYSWGIAFDENGYVDEANTQLSGAITIAEGKMRVVAKPGLATKPLLRSNRGVFVGGQCAGTQASPELELEGVQLYVASDASFKVGGGMTKNESANAPTPALRLKDADVTCVYYPKFGDRTTTGITPTFSMTNSSFIGRVQTYFGGTYGSTSMRFEAIDSKFEVGEQILITSGLSADVTNTIVSANDGNCGAFRAYNSYGSDRIAKGYFRLAAGSDFRMNEVSWAESLYIKDFKLVFDDATWTTGDVDMLLTLEAKRRSDGAAAPVDPNVFSVELQKGGLKLPVLTGRTFMTDCRFWGEGGIAKSGEGTLRFGPGAYQFKGPMCALAGTVDLSGAGTITNGCFGAGAGTIADGTLRDPVFRLDAGAPNLVNCTFAGRGYLDVGDEPLVVPYPTDVTLLRFTGTAPNVSNWRLKGAAKKGLGATFTVEGNEVKVTIEERGLLLLVR